MSTKWLEARGLSPGFQFGGYEIVRSLGQGGMGHVVLAIDTTLQREVAIKFLYQDSLSTEGAREVFLREARALARLSHPNVVSIHGAGEHEGAPYLVMEYIPGRSLQDLVASGGALGVSESLWILDQVGRGLSAVHAAGLVHRDVKAENVFVGPGRRAVLGDLGIARPAEDVAGKRQSGTPAYMAPETRFGGEQPTTARRADVFSFGVLSYFLMAGRLPFKGEVAGLRAPDPLSTLRKSIGPATDSVIAGALAANVDERTASVDEVRLALRASLRSRPIEATPKRVIVAEDDPYYREAVGVVIAQVFPEASIVAVDDGEAALAMCSSGEGADLLITDLDMPKLGGADLIREIRTRDDLGSPAIILMSAVASGTDWNLLRSLQVDGFLPKPFEPGHLKMLAQAVVEGRQKPSGGDGDADSTQVTTAESEAVTVNTLKSLQDPDDSSGSD